MTIGIIGGGPAGLAAAITAAQAGASVTLLEKMNRVGRKLLTTGNGRCNLSNEDTDLAHYHGAPAFIQKVFEQVAPEDVLNFWDGLGLRFTTENGRIYPMSLQASSALDAMRLEAERLGVRILCETPVRTIRRSKGGWMTGSGDSSVGPFDQLILTVGGKASPQLGADGDVIPLAKQLHHTVCPLRPALVKLKCASPYLKSLAGCRLDALAVLRSNGTEIDERFGEVLFTEEGLSGPPILDLSRQALEPGREAEISIVLFPEMNAGECFAMIEERCRRFPYMTLPEMLSGILNKRLIVPLIKEAGLSLQMTSGELNKRQIGALSGLLQEWTFPVIGDGGWRDAQITVGGIATEEIDPQKMSSRKEKNCYFAGEAIDVDGDCGGYNLLWAVATGILAGRSASQEHIG